MADLMPAINDLFQLYSCKELNLIKPGFKERRQNIKQQFSGVPGLILLIAFLGSWFMSFAQAPQLKFLHLNTEQGLPDGAVRGITQDKYGYMWLGTQYGLCRYNGYSVSTFFHRDNDTNSLTGNFVWSVFTDRDGDVWVGADRFLSKYQYRNTNFRNYNHSFGFSVFKIAQDEQGIFWLATSVGLIKFDKRTGKFIDYRNSINPSLKKAGTTRINDFFLDEGKGLIYLASTQGLLVFDYHKEIIVQELMKNEEAVSIHDNFISAVTKDKKGNIWFGSGYINTIMECWNSETNTIKHYDDFKTKGKGWAENRVLSLFTDIEGNLWAGGSVSSISLYLPGTDVFHHYQNDALLKSSIAGNAIITFYQDATGMIWAGSEGYGVERFHLKNTLFTSFQPQVSMQTSLLHDWGRAAMEDNDKNIWFGTAKGISIYNPVSGQYRNYFNDANKPRLISFNTIRSFAEDKKGIVWVGTGNGLNRFDKASGRFKIYDLSDSARIGFVWSLLINYKGDLYAGGTEGLHRYDQAADKFRAVNDDTSMNKKLRFNIRNIFEDSKQALWLGVYDGGLIWYHPDKKEIRYYRHDEKNENSLCNNFVTSVAEDKTGIIWISTRDGLSSLDPKKETFKTFTIKNGLPSNKTSALRVDKENRLWIATGNGLSVLDEERKFFRNFDMSDGLPTNEFSDQVATSTADGRLIYPTLRGFVLFNPDEVQKKITSATPVYVSAFKVLNKSLSLETNAEEIKKIILRPHQNFFSVELTGLNYENPDKVSYAYKLEPFDKDWIYTKERTATYTNVTGGRYTFYYKAVTDSSNQKASVQAISITVGTVFYKRTWFVLLVIALFAGIIYGIYSYRLWQTRKMHWLQLQATRLEKDKTEIQYQNLITQFNPHFLFNSLTSLNGLIYENKELASEFLEQLSTVYRYLLTHKETQLVTLELEKEFINHYISLLKTRFEKALTVTINIPGQLLQKKIVPITFQLLIENALKHNIIDESSPLVISFTADEQYLCVTNNMQKRDFVETSNRKGLESLQSLYRYLSSLPLTVDQNSREFTIRVPLL